MIFFLQNSSILGVFDQREDFKLTTRNCPKKCDIPATRCKYKKLYFQDRILCLSSSQDLILYEDDSNF